MKTAVSIPDETFERGERLARELGLSRSALYTRALEDMMAKQNVAMADEDPVTAQINRVLAEIGPESSKLDEFAKRVRARGLAAGDSDW